MADIAVVCMVLTRAQLSFVQGSLFGIAAEVKNKCSSLREKKTNKQTTTKFYENKTVREKFFYKIATLFNITLLLLILIHRSKDWSTLKHL